MSLVTVLSNFRCVSYCLVEILKMCRRISGFILSLAVTSLTKYKLMTSVIASVRMELRILFLVATSVGQSLCCTSGRFLF